MPSKVDINLSLLAERVIIHFVYQRIRANLCVVMDLHCMQGHGCYLCCFAAE